MSFIDKKCDKCNNSYYVNNIITIGNMRIQSIECPYCKAISYINSSGIPRTLKSYLRRSLPTSVLQEFNNPTKYPMFQNYVYHITSEKNWQSIKNKGLASYSLLKAKNISVTTGGNETSLAIDNNLGLDKYIHLSFTDWCPMFYGKEKLDEKLYVLHISLDVLDQPDVLFCDRIATANDAIFYDYLDSEVFDLEAAYAYLDWRTPDGQKRRNQAEKYEILVPNYIAPDKIIGAVPRG